MCATELSRDLWQPPGSSFRQLGAFRGRRNQAGLCRAHSSLVILAWAMWGSEGGNLWGHLFTVKPRVWRGGSCSWSHSCLGGGA